MTPGRIVPFAVVAALLFVLGASRPGLCTERKKTLVDTAAPAFKCPSTDNGVFSLEEALKSNDAVLMAFWGLRCGACIEEIPSLNALAAEYRGKGLKVVGVNIDGIDANFLKEMIRKMDLRFQYEVIADADLSVMDSFQVDAAPATILIDKSQKIVHIHSGYQPGDEKEIASAVARLIRK